MGSIGICIVFVFVLLKNTSTFIKLKSHSRQERFAETAT